jgi:hydrocephalus-inducing protein
MIWASIWICRSIIARTPHVEEVQVQNWLSTVQRFDVNIEVAPDAPEASVQAPAHIEVPALSSRTCKLHVLPILPGQLKARAFFVSPVSHEYCFHELDFAVTEAASTAHDLIATVRTRASQRSAISNPLGKDVVLQGYCAVKGLEYPKSVQVKAGSSLEVSLSYMPLLAKTIVAHLEYSAPELGKFVFTLRLTGQPSMPEQALTFSVPLGASETRTVRIRHFYPEKCDYAVTLPPDASQLGVMALQSVPAQAAPAGGVDVDVPITYQPTTVGQSMRCSVHLSSKDGGEFECPLILHCSEPTPQGPVRMTAAKGATLTFSNPFLTEAEFKYVCDNVSFVVKPSEKVKGRQQTGIPILFKHVPGTARTGKLSISCPALTRCVWVYYVMAE